MCNQSFCLVCRTSPWHRGVRCEQYQAENGDPEAADATFAAFAQNQKLKQCPKCTSWVEKTSGCDAMHCRCNLVFCYKCGGVLKSGHGSAKGTSIKECECAGVNQLLAAHEAPGVPNHNLMPQNQVAGAMAAAQAALQAAMQRGLPGFKPQEVANMVWAFAKARVQAKVLYNAVAKIAVQEGLAGFTPQNLSNTAWAFATSGVRAEQLFVAVAEVAMRGGLINFKPQELSNMVWAFRQNEIWSTVFLF